MKMNNTQAWKKIGKLIRALEESSDTSVFDADPFCDDHTVVSLSALEELTKFVAGLEIVGS